MDGSEAVEWEEFCVLMYRLLLMIGQWIFFFLAVCTQEDEREGP